MSARDAAAGEEMKVSQRDFGTPPRSFTKARVCAEHPPASREDSPTCSTPFQAQYARQRIFAANYNLKQRIGGYFDRNANGGGNGRPAQQGAQCHKYDVQRVAPDYVLAEIFNAVKLPLANDVQLWFKTQGPLALEIDVIGLMVRHLPADERERLQAQTQPSYARSDRHVWKVGFTLKDNDFFKPCKYSDAKAFTRAIYRTTKADAELHTPPQQQDQQQKVPLAYGAVAWALAFAKSELKKIRAAEVRHEHSMAGLPADGEM